MHSEVSQIQQSHQEDYTTQFQLLEEPQQLDNVIQKNDDRDQYQTIKNSLYNSQAFQLLYQNQQQKNSIWVKLSMGYVLIDEEKKDQKVQKKSEKESQAKQNVESKSQQQKTIIEDDQFVKSPQDLEIIPLQPYVPQYNNGVISSGLRTLVQYGQSSIDVIGKIGYSMILPYTLAREMFVYSIKEEENKELHKAIPNYMIQTVGTVGGAYSGAMYGAAIGVGAIGGPITSALFVGGYGILGGSVGGFIWKNLMPWNR